MLLNYQAAVGCEVVHCKPTSLGCFEKGTAVRFLSIGTVAPAWEVSCNTASILPAAVLKAAALSVYLHACSACNTPALLLLAGRGGCACDKLLLCVLSSAEQLLIWLHLCCRCLQEAARGYDKMMLWCEIHTLLM
jgi:hypothetical protein